MRRRLTSIEAVRETLRRAGQQGCTRGEIRLQTGFAAQTVSGCVARLMRQGEAYRRTPRGRIFLGPAVGVAPKARPRRTRHSTRRLHPTDQRVVGGVAKLLGWAAEHRKEATGFLVGADAVLLASLLREVIRGYRAVRSQG